MARVLCPRNQQAHRCPNDELAAWLEPDAASEVNECSGTCDGELTVSIVHDDPSPPGVSLGPGYYTYTEVDDQTCECELTDSEFAEVERAAAEQDDGRYDVEPEIYFDDID